MARRSRQSTQSLPVAGAGRAEPTAGAPSAAWWLVALGLAAVAVFANSLSGHFVHDDDEAILGNPFIRALWPLSSALSSPPQSAVSGRPLVSLSLAVNHAFGGLDPTGYHAWNIAVHAGGALLLFGVIRRTLRTARVPAALQATLTISRACARCSGSLLGLLLGQRGDAAAAIAAFEATLRIRPGDVDARGGLADALRAAGRLDDAERAYRAYLEVQPANAAAYGNLGAVLASQGRAEAAVAAFARGVELAPNAADARLNLGLALMALGTTDEAMAEFCRGLALDAGHVPLTTALAEALAATGARVDAIVLFRRALDLSPGNRDATAGLATVGAGAGGRLASPRR